MFESAELGHRVGKAVYAREVPVLREALLNAYDLEFFKLYDEFRAVAQYTLRTTSTGAAPWTLVPANDKLFARIKVLRTLAEAVETAL